MLVPIEKIEKPFQAIGRGVQAMVHPQAAPQQPPAQQPPPTPSVEDRAKAWQNFIGTYYSDQGVKAAHLEDLKRQAMEQEVATGELTSKQAAETAKDKQKLRAAYEEYVAAPPAEKEAKRNQLMILESVISMKPLPTKAETLPSTVKEILLQNKISLETPEEQWPQKVRDQIAESEGLPQKRLDEQRQRDLMGHEDRTASLQERILQDQYNRTQKTRSRIDKSAQVFSSALGRAEKAAHREVGPLNPGNQAVTPELIQKWNQKYDAAYAKLVHEEYDRLRSQFTDLMLSPLPEGPAGDSMALQVMINDIDRFRRGSYLENAAPTGQSQYPFQNQADAAATQNGWYSGPSGP